MVYQWVAVLQAGSDEAIRVGRDSQDQRGHFHGGHGHPQPDPKYLPDTKNGTLVGSVNDTQVFTGTQTGAYKRIILRLYVSP